MSSTDTALKDTAAAKKPNQRKIINAFWEPVMQFKLLGYMLGLTAFVAVLLGVFMYVAFGNLIDSVSQVGSSNDYFQEEVSGQLVYLFRYCGALFVLYILLLAAVCVAYTHRLIGPFRPFNRHVDELIKGNYAHRVVLRKGDVDLLNKFALKLNTLTEELEAKDKK